MSYRKITQSDIDEAYKNAEISRKQALFSLRRARQLKDGADKMLKEFKHQRKKSLVNKNK